MCRYKNISVLAMLGLLFCSFKLQQQDIRLQTVYFIANYLLEKSRADLFVYFREHGSNKIWYRLGEESTSEIGLKILKNTKKWDNPDTLIAINSIESNYMLLNKITGKDFSHDSLDLTINVYEPLPVDSFCYVKTLIHIIREEEVSGLEVICKFNKKGELVNYKYEGFIY